MSINYLTLISLILNDLKVYIIILMNLILLSNDDVGFDIDDSEQWDDAMHLLGPSNKNYSNHQVGVY